MSYFYGTPYQYWGAPESPTVPIIAQYPAPSLPIPGGPGWPPIPPIQWNPCIRILRILAAWEHLNIEMRDRASQEAERILQSEKENIEQVIINDLGPLAWAVFTLGEPTEGERYRDYLESQSCVYSMLREAARFGDTAEVRTRAGDVLQIVGRAGE